MPGAPDGHQHAVLATLYYAHDPMCSWCFAFAPAWAALQSQLPSGVVIKRLLGGLAPDTEQPMPEALREQLQATWRRIESHVPGIRFNFDFWTRCAPRRSTYPACRAVIAAREQGVRYDALMTQAIQRAYYQEARNPSEEATLIELAAELGLDVGQFTTTLRAPATHAALLTEIERADALGASGYPSLILLTSSGRWPVRLDYHDAVPMRETIEALIEP